MKNTKIKKYIIFTLTLCLVYYVLFFLKVFYSNAYIVSIPPESTPPADFEVVFGRFKLDEQCSSKKSLLTSNCWVDNKEKYFEIRPNETSVIDFYYIIEGEVVGLKGTAAAFFPEIRIVEICKIPKLIFWLFNCLLVVFLPYTLVKSYRKIDRKSVHSSQL